MLPGPVQHPMRVLTPLNLLLHSHAGALRASPWDDGRGHDAAGIPASHGGRHDAFACLFGRHAPHQHALLGPAFSRDRRAGRHPRGHDAPAVTGGRRRRGHPGWRGGPDAGRHDDGRRPPQHGPSSRRGGHDGGCARSTGQHGHASSANGRQAHGCPSWCAHDGRSCAPPWRLHAPAPGRVPPSWTSRLPPSRSPWSSGWIPRARPARSPRPAAQAAPPAPDAGRGSYRTAAAHRPLLHTSPSHRFGPGNSSVRHPSGGSGYPPAPCCQPLLCARPWQC